MRNLLASLAALIAFAAAPLAAEARESSSVPAPALAEAMKYFNVIVLADPATGAVVQETRRNADGTNQREVVIAFIDAHDTRDQLVQQGGGETLEGRLINAADLVLRTGGDVIWRASSSDTELVNGSEATALGYYIRNDQDQPLTQAVDGKAKTIIYMDKFTAQEVKAASEQKLAAAGNPVALIVSPVDAVALIRDVQSGARSDIVFRSAKSTDRWLEQWDKGARRMLDYRDESQEAIDAIAKALID